MAVLTDEEVAKLVSQFDAKGSNGDLGTEVDKYIEWCVQAKVNNALVTMLLESSIRACFNLDGEIEFCLTKKV